MLPCRRTSNQLVLCLSLFSSDTCLGCSNNFFDIPFQPLRHSGAIRWIRFYKVLNLPSLNIPWHGLHAGNDVADQAVTFGHIHEPKQVSGLRVVVSVQTMIVPVDRAGVCAVMFSIR